jgi:hypothetical protein
MPNRTPTASRRESFKEAFEATPGIREPDLLLVESLRVEGRSPALLTPGPCTRVAVLGVGRIGHDLKQGRITTRTATVVRRPRAGTIDAAWVALPGRCARNLLEGDPVHPAVAEVVLVLEVRLRGGEDLRHAKHPSREGRYRIDVIERDAVTHAVMRTAAGAELVEVGEPPRLLRRPFRLSHAAMA